MNFTITERGRNNRERMNRKRSRRTARFYLGHRPKPIIRNIPNIKRPNTKYQNGTEPDQIGINDMVRLFIEPSEPKRNIYIKMPAKHRDIFRHT